MELKMAPNEGISVSSLSQKNIGVLSTAKQYSSFLTTAFDVILEMKARQIEISKIILRFVIWWVGLSGDGFVLSERVSV